MPSLDPQAAPFEADVIDPELHTGWSVMIKGRAVDVTRPDEHARLAAIPLTLWTAGVKDHWVRVRPTDVTWRRIHSLAALGGDEPQEETLE